MSLPWLYYITLGFSVLAIFLVYLSGIVHARPMGAVLMFLLTIVTGYMLWYGLTDAYLQAEKYKGLPTSVLEEGKEYAIYWGAYLKDKKKLLFVAKRKDESPDLLPKYYEYAVEPSSEFLKEFLRNLRIGKPFKIKTGKDLRKGGEGVLKEDLTIHPDPPPPLPDKEDAYEVPF